jgi:hypothetical protein
MNCIEWHGLWQAILDGEASASDRAEFLAHEQSCASCRDLYELADHVFTGLKNAPAPTLPPHLADRVLAAVSRADRRARVGRLIAAVGGLAAAAALAWGTFRLFFVPAHIQEVAVTGRPPETAAAAPVPPSLEARLADAGSATVDLTRQMARDTLRHAALFVPHLPQGSARSESEPLFGNLFRLQNIGESPSSQRSAPVQRVSRAVTESLQPVATRAERAYKLFWELLPPTDIEAP